ncbi:MAG: protease inhibitor I42 family protein [Acidimicrobiia bacterium]|nr:protease inhibitor I42 family protein [Acidimicrobiia bacterium]
MRVLTVVLWVITLVAMACGSDSATDTGDLRVLTEAENGQEVLFDSGEQFEVRLESNASTGFSWEIAGETGPMAVELRTRSYVEPDTDLVGAPGTEVFRFEAIGDAEILRLEYIRSFDDPPIPERIIEYIVRVDDAPWPPEGIEPPTTSSALAPIEISELLAAGSGDASIIGYVVIDSAGARLCEALAESFPPQCGGASVTIANPDALTVALEQEQSTQWTDERVRLDGTYDGDTFTITN